MGFVFKLFIIIIYRFYVEIGVFGFIWGFYFCIVILVGVGIVVVWDGFFLVVCFFTIF